MDTKFRVSLKRFKTIIEGFPCNQEVFWFLHGISEFGRYTIIMVLIHNAHFEVQQIDYFAGSDDLRNI